MKVTPIKISDLKFKADFTGWFIKQLFNHPHRLTWDELEVISTGYQARKTLEEIRIRKGFTQEELIMIHNGTYEP